MPTEETGDWWNKG